jgi:hypothetical protein
MRRGPNHKDIRLNLPSRVICIEKDLVDLPIRRDTDLQLRHFLATLKQTPKRFQRGIADQKHSSCTQFAPVVQRGLLYLLSPCRREVHIASRNRSVNGDTSSRSFDETFR